MTLTDKTDAELVDLVKSLRRKQFDARLSNYTNQLDDTASIKKVRRETARTLTELRRRELAGEVVSG